LFGKEDMSKNKDSMRTSVIRALKAQGEGEKKKDIKD